MRASVKKPGLEEAERDPAWFFVALAAGVISGAVLWALVLWVMSPLV